MRRVQGHYNKLESENKSLKVQLDKCMLLLKAQQTLLEDDSMSSSHFVNPATHPSPFDHIPTLSAQHISSLSSEESEEGEVFPYYSNEIQGGVRGIAMPSGPASRRYLDPNPAPIPTHHPHTPYNDDDTQVHLLDKDEVGQRIIQEDLQDNLPIDENAYPHVSHELYPEEGGRDPWQSNVDDSFELIQGYYDISPSPSPPKSYRYNVSLSPSASPGSPTYEVDKDNT
ncbi:hypothetical protein EON65_52435 [archaeon]|nr:MAG: hypothetical protein EON65_52435 [archaeon]